MNGLTWIICQLLKSTSSIGFHGSTHALQEHQTWRTGWRELLTCLEPIESSSIRATPFSMSSQTTWTRTTLTKVCKPHPLSPAHHYHSSSKVVVNARRACARGLQYFLCLSVCLSVCYQSPGFFSRLHDKLDLPACSSLVFLGFQLTDFDKTVSFGR